MKKRISIVLPIYNEMAIIEKLALEIERQIAYPMTFIFVNDGSTDKSLEVLRNLKLNKAESRKRIVNLSRNFGHQKALMAGLSCVTEDCDLILVMDSDFQDAPGDIPALIEKLEEGYDCVYAVRTANSGSLAINFFTRTFYKIQQKILAFSIPQHAGTFSVFNRDFLKKILEFQEVEIYFPGLRAYVGMKQIGVRVNRGERSHGDSKVGKMGLINLSLTGILGFSVLPMRLIFLFGLAVTIICFLLGLAFFFMKIMNITKIMGVTTVIILMLSLFGIQIMFIGIVGEYVGKLFIESKRRPRWLIEEIIDENPLHR